MDHNPHQIKTAVMIGHDRYICINTEQSNSPASDSKLCRRLSFSLGKHNTILDIVQRTLHSHESMAKNYVIMYVFSFS